MVEIFGHFVEQLPHHAEYLIIGFSPTSVPLKQRWRNNGLSADFISDYLQTFFVRYDSQRMDCNQLISKEIREAVKYIANELLENAMKFSDESINYPTNISFYLLNNQLIFYVTNSVNKQSIHKFKTVIETILNTTDPQMLYISQMEANALEENNYCSGLGFLSMICDYSAQLSWKFETVNEPPFTIVTTMAILTI